MTTRCAVCNKKLTNPTSVAAGVGPTCAKNVGRFLQAAENDPRARQAWENWTAANGNRVGVRDFAVETARAQFLARIHRQHEIPVATGYLDETYSATRDRNETLSYEQFQNGAVIVHSASGRDYVVNTDNTGRHPQSCTCPDHMYRGRNCRHMQGYDELVQERFGEQAEQDEQPQPQTRQPRTDNAVEIGNRATAATVPIIQAATQVELDQEELRELNITNWHDRHAHDGVFMSQDDNAWENLQRRAMENMDGSYEYDSVLDGHNTTFGIELEVEGISGDVVARALHGSGLSAHSNQLGYHARSQSGSWAVHRDGSLSGGGEIVSPILRDTPETWQAVEEVTRILNNHGARVNNRTGFHIHMGHEVLDDRGYRWQRLGRHMWGFQDQYFRMGAASTDDTTMPARHRGSMGSGYAKPLSGNAIRKISRHDTAMDASRKIIDYSGHQSRYHMINTAKYVENGVPTVEFRYPNGTVDKNVVQHQVKLANMTLMQSAYLRKGRPGADRLPKLFSHDEAIDLSTDSTTRFRQYLDTLGSDRLRLVATRLWMRGRN